MCASVSAVITTQPFRTSSVAGGGASSVLSASQDGLGRLSPLSKPPAPTYEPAIEAKLSNVEIHKLSIPQDSQNTLTSIIDTTRRRLQNASGACQKRLVDRQQHLTTIQTQVKSGDITLIGFVGWGDGCTQRIDKGTPGVSQYHSVIYEKNGVRVVETLGSAISIFDRPLAPTLSTLSALAIPTSSVSTSTTIGTPLLPKLANNMPITRGRVYAINPNAGLDTGVFTSIQPVNSVDTGVLVIDLTRSTYTTQDTEPQPQTELVIPYSNVIYTYDYTSGTGVWKHGPSMKFLVIKKGSSKQSKPQWITGMMCNKTCPKQIKLAYSKLRHPSPSNGTSVTFPVPMIFIPTMLVPKGDGELIQMSEVQESDAYPKKSGIYWPIHGGKWPDDILPPNQFNANGFIFSINSELKYDQS